MFKGDALKVLTAEVRLSYVHIDKPYAQDQNAEPKFSCTILLPKTETACYNEIVQAIEAAKQDGIRGKWKGACPPNPSITLYDGDGLKERSGEPYGPECHGHWVITAKSNWKPQVVHVSNIQCPLPEGSIKSGDYGRVVLTFYPYDSNGNRGIACSLGNIMMTREGESLGGQTNAADDFADFAGAGYTAPQQSYGQPAQSYGQPAPYQQPQQAYGQPAPYQQPPQAYGQPQQAYDPNAFNPNTYYNGGYGG